MNGKGSKTILLHGVALDCDRYIGPAKKNVHKINCM